MPNFAATLKDEISRLSRREIKRQMLPVRRASTAHRKHIASLKREVARLEKLVSTLSRRGPAAVAPATRGAAANEATGQRFQARGLVSLRKRLGLSAAELAKLVGVSAQSIYNWEHRKASPRRSQIAQIAQLRGLGKKEARARLGGAGEPAPEGPATQRGRKGGRKAGAVAKKAVRSAPRAKRAARARRKAK